MIKFATMGKNGPLVGLGVSRENIRRLTAGRPILVQMKELGGQGDIMIFFGEDEEDLKRQIEPMMGPKTKTIDKSRPEGTHWSMTVQVDFPISPEDTAIRHKGDAEIDFANRGVARIRGRLEEFRRAIAGNYTIMSVDGRNQLAKRSYG